MTIALGVYRHSKGNLYEVTAIAKDATNGGNAGLPCVVYRSEKTGDVFIRDLDQFVELVTWPDGVVRPRFNLVVKADPAEELTFVSRASELVSLFALAKVTKERDAARRWSARWKALAKSVARWWKRRVPRRDFANDNLSLRLLRAGPSPDGGFEFVMKPSAVISLYADAFGDFIDQPERRELFEFTIRRFHGKTPLQLKNEAEAARDAALAKVAELEAEAATWRAYSAGMSPEPTKNDISVVSCITSSGRTGYEVRVGDLCVWPFERDEREKAENHAELLRLAIWPIVSSSVYFDPDLIGRLRQVAEAAEPFALYRFFINQDGLPPEQEVMLGHSFLADGIGVIARMHVTAGAVTKLADAIEYVKARDTEAEDDQ